MLWCKVYPLSDQVRSKHYLSRVSHAEGLMNWYNYIACFFAGAFLANVVPHFFHGISGDRFPTPFAKPPGRGLSSPTTNVVWASINLVVGYVLFRAGKVSVNCAARGHCFHQHRTQLQVQSENAGISPRSLWPPNAPFVLSASSEARAHLQNTSSQSRDCRWHSSEMTLAQTGQ